MSTKADILITGASAFVGRHVLKRLAQSGSSIVATTRSPIGNDDPLRRLKNVHLVTLDLDERVSYDALPDKVDAIVHIAAASSVAPTSDVIRANICGMQSLVDYAKRADAKRFIFTSSLSVHGEISQKSVDVDTPIVNPGVYGLSKRMGELMLKGVAEEFSSVAIRLPGVLGDGAQRHWAASVLQKALKGEVIEIYNPHDPFNNVVDVTALSDFIFHLIGSDLHGAHTIPVASSGFMTVEGAVLTIIKQTGSVSSVIVLPSDKTSYTIDIAQAEDLGFIPTSIKDALVFFASNKNTKN